MTCETTVRTCSRCYDTGDMFEMESIKTRRDRDIVDKWFHPSCYDAYVYGKLAYEKGVSGVEYDMEGNRINLEKTFSRKDNKTGLTASLIETLSSMQNPEAWIDANIHLFK